MAPVDGWCGFYVHMSNTATFSQGMAFAPVFSVCGPLYGDIDSLERAAVITQDLNDKRMITRALQQRPVRNLEALDTEQ